jgi:hypothetical protein
VGKAVIERHSAVVVGLFSSFCIEDKCRTNAEPSAGLPNKADFAAAYRRAQGFSHTTVACELTDGKWYVVIGTGLSPQNPS